MSLIHSADQIQSITSMSSREKLSSLFSESDPKGASWVTSKMKEFAEAGLDVLLSAMNEALHDVRRVASKRFVILSFSERAAAATPSPYGDVPIGHWKINELSQIYMISTVMSERYEKKERYAALYRLYDLSDTEGKVACLRALNFMEGVSEDALRVINDAGRTYLSDLMEAAWCANPYASITLSIEELRKAVMKALFCQVSIEGFMGIDRLADPELSRRLIEFADEREAAGRTVPAEVWRVAAFFPVPGLVARLIGKLEHPMREERQNAVLCLSRAQDPLALPFMADRLSREEDPEVQNLLHTAIERIQDRK